MKKIFSLSQDHEIEGSQNPSYETIYEKKGVLVKVPKSTGLYMNKVEKHRLFNGEWVGPYWKNGLYFPPSGQNRQGVYLNRIFYDLAEPDDLGRFIVADIKVVRKKLPDGREFVHLDIRRQENAIPLYDLKFPKGAAGDVPIPGTDAWISFIPRQQKDEG